MINQFKVCNKCFQDKELIGFITSFQQEGTCDFCKQKISKDLSKPLRRYDSEIDYIPTQFICEFIKAYTDVKGIKFKSSLHDTGNNLVIFDHDIMRCTKVEKCRVEKVSITAKNSN